MNEHLVGRYFVDEAGEVWQLIAYAGQPTVTFQKVKEPTERRSGCVGSPIVSGLSLLTPQRAGLH
jgi:hypothetical protein